MTGSNFASLVRKYTSTDSNTLDDDDLVLFANVAKDEVAQLIVDNVDEDYFQMTFERNLRDTSSDVSNREFSFPNDILKHMVRAYAKIDGDWEHLEEYDDGDFDDYPMVTEENVTDAMSSLSLDPGFILQGRGVFLVTEESLDAVTDGLRLEAMLYPENIEKTDLSVNTDLSVPTSPNADEKHALPRQAHKLWAMLTSIEYKNSRPKPIPLNFNEENIEKVQIPRVVNQLKKRNIGRAVTADVENPDAGFDY